MTWFFLLIPLHAIHDVVCIKQLFKFFVRKLLAQLHELVKISVTVCVCAVNRTSYASFHICTYICIC